MPLSDLTAAEHQVLLELGVIDPNSTDRFHLSKVYDPTNPRHVRMATPDADLAAAMTREVLARVRPAAP